MKNRILISFGAMWEVKVGYSRAVRVGNIIEVSQLINPELLFKIEVSAIIQK